MPDHRVLPSMMLGALITVAFGEPPAAAQTPSQPAGQVRTACAADVRTLCSGVTPGGGRIAQCMREKKDQLSEGCKSALMASNRSNR